MIAANYRKHPDAMALQLVLHFGRALVWATKRPGIRILRAIRSQRGKTFKAAGRISYPTKQATPQWVKDARQRAQALAKRIRAACQEIRPDTTPATVITDLAWELALHFEHLASL